MRITTNLSVNENETTASVTGEVITVNGTAYDLSSVPEGGLAQPQGDHPFKGHITREDGVIHVVVNWYYNADTSETNQPMIHPVFEITDGDVPDPVKRLSLGEYT